MNNLELYKHLSETKMTMDLYGIDGMQGFVYDKDTKTLKIYYSDEEYPSLIQNKDFIERFEKLNNEYVGDVFKTKVYELAMELLTVQMDKCREEAKLLAKNDNRVLKVRCVKRSSDGKLVYKEGRSTNITYKMSEIYGMKYETCLQKCRETVHQWRNEDSMDWHVLDENDNIIC